MYQVVPMHLLASAEQLNRHQNLKLLKYYFNTIYNVTSTILLLQDVKE